MFEEIAQKNLSERVSVTLDGKLEEEYPGWTQENSAKIFMVPPEFRQKKELDDAGAEAEREVYNALERVNEERPDLNTHYFGNSKDTKMFGFVFRGLIVDGEEIDFVYVTKHGLVVSECKASPDKYQDARQQLERKIPILLRSFGLDPSNTPVFKVVSLPLSSRRTLQPIDGIHVLFKEDLNNLKSWFRSKIFLEESNASAHAFEKYLFIAKKFLYRYHSKGNFKNIKRAVNDSSDQLERTSETFYNKEQAALLTADLSTDVLVEGAAGTGKTFMLKKLVEEIGKLYSKEDRPLILVITFNRAIKEDILLWLEKRMGRKMHLVRVQTLSSLIWHLGIQNLELEQAIDTILAQPQMLIHYNFHHILVDEAQDLPGKWLSLLRCLLDKERRCGIQIFYDPFQTVRRINAMKELKTFAVHNRHSLKKVVRNTRNIFEAYELCYDRLRENETVRQLPSSPKVHHSVSGMSPVYVTAEDNNQLKNELLLKLQRLQREGVPFIDIAVISYGDNIKITSLKSFLHLNRIKCTDAENGTKLKHAGNKTPDPPIIVDSYQRFKGLESKVLIFYIPTEWPPRDQDIYVGFSRAFCHLIVIGTRMAINKIKQEYNSSF